MTLTGELSFKTAPAFIGRADALIANGTLDLSAVTRADSAGIALLLELSRRAQARGQRLTLSGANAQVRGLIKFFALDAILVLA